MRRSEREITDTSEIIRILEQCDVCRLALSEANVPYIVPVNYGFEYVDDKMILYFHGASEGKKHDIIAKNPLASFEIDCSHKLIEAAKACDYAMEYESVIGSGTISYVVEKSEKTKALKQLMKQYARDRDFIFLDNAINSVTVFKLVVSEFTAKRLRKR